MNRMSGLFLCVLPFLVAGCATSTIYPASDLPPIPLPRPDVTDEMASVPVETSPGATSYRPRNEGWVAPPSNAGNVVRRAALPPASNRLPPLGTNTLPPLGVENTQRVLPTDPPRDVKKIIRTYSSRPDKFKQDPANLKEVKPEASEIIPGRVRSSWADQNVPSSDRADFNRMVLQASAKGSARYQDADGFVYLADVRELRSGCAAIEVQKTRNGSLPILSRGTAEVC